MDQFFFGVFRDHVSLFVILLLVGRKLGFRVSQTRGNMRKPHLCTKETWDAQLRLTGNPFQRGADASSAENSAFFAIYSQLSTLLQASKQASKQAIDSFGP